MMTIVMTAMITVMLMIVLQMKCLASNASTCICGVLVSPRHLEAGLGWGISASKSASPVAGKPRSSQWPQYWWHLVPGNVYLAVCGALSTGGQEPTARPNQWRFAVKIPAFSSSCVPSSGREDPPVKHREQETESSYHRGGEGVSKVAARWGRWRWGLFIWALMDIWTAN